MLSRAVALPRRDGFFDIDIDTTPPFRLPSVLGRLFQLLAEDVGHDVNDGAVGFKSTGHLLQRLRVPILGSDAARNHAAGVNRASLARAIHELRGELGQAVPHGAALVQARRGLGRRIVVRRTTRAGGRIIGQVSV